MELPGKVCDLCQICNWARTVTVTKVKYNSILVVVDKLTKYTHLILWQETETMSELTNVLLRELVSQ